MQARTLELPLVGPSAKAGAPAQQAGRTVNFLIEASGFGADVQYALKWAHGYFRRADFSETLTDIPATSGIRGMHRMGSRAFVAVHNYILELIDILDETAEPQYLVLCRLSTFRGYVGFSDNNGVLVIGDGAGFFTYDFDTAVLSPVLNSGSEQLRGYISRWIDGTTLYFHRNSGTYSYSAVGDATTVQGQWFFAAEGNPDNIVNAFVVNSEIVIIGERSTEWHWNTGDADNPFQRMSGGFVEYGCIGMKACCRFDNTVVMVGQNSDGAGKVWALGGAGSQPVVLSDQAFERKSQKVMFSADRRTAEISMFSFEDAGHVQFYVNLPDVSATANNPEQSSSTWVFDGSVPRELAWTERGRTNPETGGFDRILAEHHLYWKGRHYTGSYAAPQIHEQSLDYYRENTTALVKWRELGPITMPDGGPFSLSSLEFMGQKGVGRDAGVQGSDPQLLVQIAWDGKWQPVELSRDWGKIGETDCRSLFGPCGSGRQLSIRVSCSEPIPFLLTECVAQISR